ncbi:MAG: hypothetical protein MUC92_08860 [Fimbriimonadaceae bacterium]|jgi:glutamate formiminotransferase|nr:hypothetical protein [Fimbriimonadaceae bacterium]
MKVLTVPNWSFGRDRSLFRSVRDLLEQSNVTTHFCEGDLDHNRTVTAFSGESEEVKKILLSLADLILPSINLQRHVGVHPRIGGLDVCPFLPLTKTPPINFNDWVRVVAQEFAETHRVPVYLYEKSASPERKADLPSLRKGGFGGLLDRPLDPDFGPNQVNPYLGASVFGWREFLIAMNVNLRGENLAFSQKVAQMIRRNRQDKVPGFSGVRALGLPLATQGLVQVSLNLTQPHASPIDDVITFVEQQAEKAGEEVAWPELIGVILDQCLEHATKLPFRPEQVVSIS